MERISGKWKMGINHSTMAGLGLRVIAFFNPIGARQDLEIPQYSLKSRGQLLHSGKFMEKRIFWHIRPGAGDGASRKAADSRATNHRASNEKDPSNRHFLIWPIGSNFANATALIHKRFAEPDPTPDANANTKPQQLPFRYCNHR